MSADRTQDPIERATDGVAEDGIEGRIADIIVDKRSLIDGLLDSDVDEVTFHRAARDQFDGRELPQRELQLGP